MTTLQPLRRRAAAVSAPLLLALSLTACGGGGDAASAPDDASSDDFCAALDGLSADIDESDSGAILEAAKKSGETLAEVGTPSGFSDDARKGFELYIDFVAQADESDVENTDDLEEAFGDDADKLTAFFTEAASSCAGDLQDQLGDLEGQLPSDFPSDLEGQLTSDFPS